MNQTAPFDVPTLVGFAEVVMDALGDEREAIDALNVYPVPDGDTGTNMYLTMEAARDALTDWLEAGGGTYREALQVYSRGALLGARGNSGVILSQVIGELFRKVAEADDPTPAVFAAGLVAASRAAWDAVGEPVEGTILSVAKAAAAASEAWVAEHPDTELGHVLGAAVAAAQVALDRTPEQLEVLRNAGVVDAGGQGLVVVLQAAESALTGRTPVPSRRAKPLPVPLPTGDLTEGGPAYEVMYLLDADDYRIPDLRARMRELGDSIVIVGGDRLWNVHVHTDDVGAAVEAGIEIGQPSRIRVTHFAEQVARAKARSERKGRAVVAVAVGPGIAALFREAGAHVIDTGMGRRPSAGEIMTAVLATGAAEVIILPNDPDSIAVAEVAATAAKESEELRVVVVPTKAQVQGIAALAVHEPARSFSADVVQMTSAARGTRHGAVTIAAKSAITTAGPCEAGDALGVIQGDFAVVGQRLDKVALEVIDRLMIGGGELVTLVTGAGGGDLAQDCEAHIESQYRGVDVLVYDGGQERYPLFMAVE